MARLQAIEAQCLAVCWRGPRDVAGPFANFVSLCLAADAIAPAGGQHREWQWSPTRCILTRTMKGWLLRPVAKRTRLDRSNRPGHSEHPHNYRKMARPGW